MSRTSPISTSRLSISDRRAETEFSFGELSARASGTPRLFATSSPSVLEKKRRQLPAIVHFLAAHFLIAEHSMIPSDRGTKIIIVFPGFPFVCTLRFPVRFFFTPWLNPRRRAEEGKKFLRKNSRRNHRSVTFRHLYQILRWPAFDF